MACITKKSIYIPYKRVIQSSVEEKLQENKNRLTRHARRMLTLTENRKDGIIKSDAIAQTYIVP